MHFLFKRDICLPFHGSSYIRTDLREAWNCISKLLQLSRDGLYDVMQKCVENETGKTLFNWGSCGLDIPHDDLRHGCKTANWNIEDSLTCLRWLFKHSPTRQEYFRKATRGVQLCPWIFGKCFSCLENTLIIA